MVAMQHGLAIANAGAACIPTRYAIPRISGHFGFLAIASRDRGIATSTATGKTIKNATNQTTHYGYGVPSTAPCRMLMRARLLRAKLPRCEALADAMRAMLQSNNGLAIANAGAGRSGRRWLSGCSPRFCPTTTNLAALVVS